MACHREIPVQSRRRGATLVETAFVLGMCWLLLFGMLEMHIVLVRHMAMCEAARRLARAAIVHGSKADAAMGSWGPATINTNAGENHSAALVVRDVLMTLDPGSVAIKLEWPDGSNDPDERVRATLTCTHHPIMPFPGWNTDLELQGVSTMRIAH